MKQEAGSATVDAVLRAGPADKIPDPFDSENESSAAAVAHEKVLVGALITCEKP